IINMSFGDFIYSKVLRDVIRYAYKNGCVVVTSSGNSGDDRLTYPALFDETISAGALTQEDSLSSFSTFGNTLDVTAPGSSVYSTKTGDDYGTVSGTSFAAPFVSGLAALLISHNPALTPELVRSILTGTADDLGADGYDYRYGAGRINAERALKTSLFLIAKIETESILPQSEGVYIKGTAAGRNMRSYSLFYGEGNNPVSWEAISSGVTNQIINGSLAYWDISGLQEGTYVLKLVVDDYTGRTVEDRVILTFKGTVPDIRNFSCSDIIDENSVALLVKFETAEPTRARVYYRFYGSQGRFRIMESEYAVKKHNLIITADKLYNNTEFFVEAESEQGVKSALDNGGLYYTYEKKLVSFADWEMRKKEYSMPSSFLLPVVTDFDKDGRKEIIANVYEHSFSF
ncbi:S8 family serine peptidase, partial [bacterium]|nr:S8 family serine peptidase [bacterium]